MKPRKPIRKIGKKGRRNRTINKSLKSTALQLGLPLICELRLEGCQTSQPPLDWAHSKRRWRWGRTNEFWLQAAIACRSCHELADSMGETENMRLIQEAIERRETNLVEGA